MVIAENKGDQPVQDKIFSIAQSEINRFTEHFSRKFLELDLKLTEVIEIFNYFTYLVRNHEIGNKVLMSYYGETLNREMQGLQGFFQNMRQVIKKEKILSSQSQILAKVTREPDVNKSFYDGLLKDLDVTESEIKHSVNFWVRWVGKKKN